MSDPGGNARDPHRLSEIRKDRFTHESLVTAWEHLSGRDLSHRALGATRSPAFSGELGKAQRSDRKAFATAPRAPRHSPSAARPQSSIARRDSNPIRQPATWQRKPPATVQPQSEDGGPGDRQDSVRWLPLLHYWSLTLPKRSQTLTPQMGQNTAHRSRKLQVKRWSCNWLPSHHRNCDMLNAETPVPPKRVENWLANNVSMSKLAKLPPHPLKAHGGNAISKHASGVAFSLVWRAAKSVTRLRQFSETSSKTVAICQLPAIC
jgi:hypothetical protein